jgi:hypothetical protein
MYTQTLGVCDDCINVAYDNGIQGYEAQCAAMRNIGRDCEDHMCIKHEGEGDLCGCPC